MFVADFLKRAASDSDVVGAVLSGSRAREGMATVRSDHDIYLVTASDTQPSWLPPRSAELDVNWMPLSAFRTYALPGHPADWDRYAFVHVKILIDKADIAGIVARKARLTAAESRELALTAMGGYVNAGYRAAKSRRDGRPFAAHLDAVEGLQSALAVMFAVHRRVRPYNKYLAWELEKEPLPRWPADDLLAALEAIVRHDDVPAGQWLFGTVEAALTTAGWFSVIEDDWGSDLDLLRPA
ncbi:hypothetical protein [Fodinicola acaciae]|uniref:hypothetical protein n=1 Tax=Fodinicola acaciae TaxID=2681555 RepID=UPI0013CFE46A|nr:hypothetical protein [Fodinicola acaciae]